ncbi:MAG: tetratricopeptide repeat protein, partial [Thermoanaerobaculia bacterium]
RHRAEWYLAASDVAAASGDIEARVTGLERAIAIYERAAPRNSGHEAALSNLGALAFDRNDLPKALGLLDRALAVVRDADSDVATDLARIQSRRGRVLTELGRLAEARKAFEEARRVFEQTLGLEHASAWQATAGLALVEQRLGDRAASDLLFASVRAAPGYPLEVNGERRAEVDALYRRCLAERAPPTSLTGSQAPPSLP